VRGRREFESSRWGEAPDRRVEPMLSSARSLNRLGHGGVSDSWRNDRGLAAGQANGDRCSAPRLVLARLAPARRAQ
jgi:hypothetical protein